MRFLFTFVAILGVLPALVRWTINGNISVGAAVALALLAVALLSTGGSASRIVFPLIALAGFGLQYAPKQTLAGFWSAITALLPIAIVLFGIYLMLGGFRSKRIRHCRSCDE